jgi:hypothetical protein
MSSCRDPSLAWDMNADGIFTLSDIGLMISSGIDKLMHSPGNHLIDLMVRLLPNFSQFMEVSHQLCGGLLSLMLSALLWVIIISVVGWIKTNENRDVWEMIQSCLKKH